ncbi:MAG: hypothetical protein D6753_03755 [Planctomycetota bacterium]|nr:MAG: hypothetical protein D6753_03755 [Planctomycetota bacterium]
MAMLGWLVLGAEAVPSIWAQGAGDPADASNPSNVVEDRATHAAPEDKPLAMLGRRPLTRQHVDLVLGRNPALGLPPLDPAVEKAAIALIAKRMQALQTLRKLKMAPDRPAILQWIARAQQVDAPEDWVQRTSQQWQVDPDTLLETLEFRLAWEQYLSKHLTEANLSRHFQNQRSRFDGTRFLISLVTAPAPAGSGPARDAVAEQLRDWAQSVTPPVEESASWSQPPPADWHCDVRRWVRGTGECDPWIVDAILRLEPGDPPAVIHSAAAVHAVWLHEQQPGERPFEQAQDDVRAHLLVYLLDYLAGQSARELPLQSVSE